jgi:hypothetical protein
MARFFCTDRASRNIRGYDLLGLSIAVGTAKRSSALRDVPTIAALGYRGFEVSLWLGFFAQGAV